MEIIGAPVPPIDRSRKNVTRTNPLNNLTKKNPKIQKPVTEQSIFDSILPTNKNKNKSKKIKATEESNDIRKKGDVKRKKRKGLRRVGEP